MAGIAFAGSVVDVLFRGVTIAGFWVTSWAGAAGMAGPRARARRGGVGAAGLGRSDAAVRRGLPVPLERVKEAVLASTRAARGSKVLLRF